MNKGYFGKYVYVPLNDICVVSRGISFTAHPSWDPLPSVTMTNGNT